MKNIPFLKKLFKKKSSISLYHPSPSPSKRINSPEEHRENSQLKTEQTIAFFVHEFRNPLTSLIGFTQFLEQHPTIKDDPTLTHYVSIMKDESLRMDSLIQELLNVSPSHRGVDALSIINVKSSLEKVISIYQPQVEKCNIVITTNVVNDLYVTGKADRFERMIINLLKNAIEAVQENGTIDVTATKSGGNVLISIIDSGPGLSLDKINHVFTPFFTTKKEGAGIGLTISKATAESLDGSIHLEKHPRKGLHVKISLPECTIETMENA